MTVVATDPDSDPLTFTWSVVSGPGTVTFTISGKGTGDTSTASFSTDGTYTIRVTVSDGALTDTGDVIVTVDTTAPSVVSTFPADMTTGLATSVTAQVTFSEAMDQAATEGAFSISPAVTGTFSWSVPGDVLTFAPGAALAEQTAYSVTIGTGAADMAGNTLAAPYSFSFTTGSSSDDDGCGCAPPGADKMSALQHSVGAALGYLLLAFLAAWARSRAFTSQKRFRLQLASRCGR